MTCPFTSWPIKLLPFDQPSNPPSRSHRHFLKQDHYLASPQHLSLTEVTAHLVSRWLKPITARVWEQAWPQKALRHSAAVHKNTKTGALACHSALIYLFDFFVDA